MFVFMYVDVFVSQDIPKDYFCLSKVLEPFRTILDLSKYTCIYSVSEKCYCSVSKNKWGGSCYL